jgi:tRNA dimethylallyltransferase
MYNVMMTEIIALVGPTAVGKTEISHKLADKFNFEIVSCDSMQVYKGMDVGTAKPSLGERQKYHYHMVDIVPPDYHYSAGEYAREADRVIEDISERGKTPLVSGGTGLYLDALVYGISSMPEADMEFRNKLQKEAEEKGVAVLYERLKEVDPESAQKIHPNDLKRIIRALEVYEITGMPISGIQKEEKPVQKYESLLIGLNMERAELYRGIDARVDKMFDEGLVEEVKTLLDKGYNPELSSFQALGYKEVVDYLNGKYSLEETKKLVKKNTRNFAKRQLTYFRKNKDIKWFDTTQENDIIAVFAEVGKFIKH